MSNERKPVTKVARVLYFHNNRVVRVVTPGEFNSIVRHHNEPHFNVANSELFTATKDECKAYLGK